MGGSTMSYDHGLAAAQRDYDNREALAIAYYCERCDRKGVYTPITEDEFNRGAMCDECIDECMEQQKEDGDE